jgi:hypothetical protein
MGRTGKRVQIQSMERKKSMKIKKILSFVFAAMLALSLVACGSAESETTGTAKPSNPTGSSSSTQEGTKPSGTSKEQVLVEDENITVKVTGTQEDSLWGYTVKVYLENNTDKDLMFSVDDVSVNGFMCDPFWASTVAAGKKANEKITFSEKSFEENGIEAVEEITFTLHVYDSNDFSADSVLKETFTIQP